MLHSQLLTLSCCVAFLTPRVVPRGVAVPRQVQLRSMAEDADDFPSDSAVPDEPDAAPFDFAFEKEGEENALRAEILGQLKQYHPGKVDEEMEKRFAAAPTAS